MNPRGRDAVAEAFIVAVVIVVLGVTAVRTKAEPTDEEVTRVAAQVRMTSPIANACLPSVSHPDRACLASAPIERR